MRQFLLSLSENQRFRKWVEQFPPTKRLSTRFVAGENLEDALREIEVLNSNSILATLDHLGENTHNADEAKQSANVYINILDRIEASGVQSNVSLKLTQMGLDVDEELCYQNLKNIVHRARELDNFVRIDMESSDYTDRTLNLYRRLRTEGYENLGIVIQTYLRRSRADLDSLREHGLNVRICKGAYAEPESVAFPEKSKVDQNYLDLLEYLWGSHRGSDVYVAVATHDEQMISGAKELVGRYGVERDRFEFQMLYGIRQDLQQQFANDGFKVRVYVSYGREWYPYFMRRLAERPANIFFLLKNLFRK